jgi:hypothetical protein
MKLKKIAGDVVLDFTSGKLVQSVRSTKEITSHE